MSGIPEFLVIVESSADARTATRLAERVLFEKVEWLESDFFEHIFQWKGLEQDSEHSCWKDVVSIIARAKINGLHIPRFLGHGGAVIKADGAAARKILGFAQVLRHKSKRPIGAVLLIRDLDHQPERREGIEQARNEHEDSGAGFAVIVGTADRMREAWVLNGFTPSNPEETRLLEQAIEDLGFHPCEEAHRLRSTSWEEPDRRRNPKCLLEKLTGGDYSREERCWTETSLEELRATGANTGLTDYLNEVEQRLVPVLRGPVAQA
jgi:hypothetical protein